MSAHSASMLRKEPALNPFQCGQTITNALSSAQRRARGPGLPVGLWSWQVVAAGDGGRVSVPWSGCCPREGGKNVSRYTVCQLAGSLTMVS